MLSGKRHFDSKNSAHIYDADRNEKFLSGDADFELVDFLKTVSSKKTKKLISIIPPDPHDPAKSQENIDINLKYKWIFENIFKK